MSDLTHNALDVLVLPVHLLHPEDVVAEIEALEAPLLTEEDDHDAPGPVQTLAEQLPKEEKISTIRSNLDNRKVG